MNLFLSPVSLLLLFCIHLSFLFSFFFFIFPPLFFFWTPFPLLHFFFLDVFSFPRSSNNFFFFSFWRIKIFFLFYIFGVLQMANYMQNGRPLLSGCFRKPSAHYWFFISSVLPLPSFFFFFYNLKLSILKIYSGQILKMLLAITKMICKCEI